MPTEHTLPGGYGGSKATLGKPCRLTCPECWPSGWNPPIESGMESPWPQSLFTQESEMSSKRVVLFV